MNKIFLKFVHSYNIYIVLGMLVAFSYFAFLLYFQGGLLLNYADAISRLDIARKVIDNITPGLPQIGNVWLPLPQLLMVPFIGNDYMWHTGMAGYFMSGASFIIGGIYIYRSARLLTDSIVASFFSVLIYALNINILYLQTTAMSESIFLASLAATIYYFLQWFHLKQKTSIMKAAVSLSALTLIRYEGLAILIPSIFLVFFFSIITFKKMKIAEGNTILYTTLACLGFGLWTLYLTVIFKNPLYWKAYYTTPTEVIGTKIEYSQAKPLYVALWQYFTSFVWMIGLVPTLFAIVGILIMMYVCWKKRSWNFLVLLMPLSIFLFMALTLQRNTPIVQPDLNLKNILSGVTSNQTGFNIRYGILLLPWVAIMCSYLLIWKNKFLKSVLFVILIGLFGLQLYTYVVPAYTFIYKIPARIIPKPFAQSVAWMQKNYDGGKILISASSQEDQMFAMGFPYSTYIHEGTNKYWKESLNNPSRYAKWVVIDYGNNADNLAKHMNRKDILKREYKLVFTEKQLVIYKKFTKPYYTIN